jgi:hypothetical protein
MNRNLNYKELEKYALGDDDLRRILGNNITIVSYPDLKHLNDIDEVFDDMGRCILLFLTQDESSGHWLCMHKEGDDIHYFDPYGNTLLDLRGGDKEWLSMGKLKQLQQENPLLLKLLIKSNKKVYYSTYSYQKDKTNVNTCGRHCCVRLLYKNLDLKQYYDMIKNSGLTPDEFVTNITFHILKK